MGWTLPIRRQGAKLILKSLSYTGSSIMEISTIFIELAKNVFQLVIFDEQHKIQQERRLSRAAFHQLMKNHPPSTKLSYRLVTPPIFGNLNCCQVQLIPVQHATPFVHGNNNDRNNIYQAQHGQPVSVDRHTI